MIEAAANAGAGRRHDHDRHVEVARARPALVTRDLEQIDGVEAVIAELNLGDRPASRVGDAHGGADDAALIERRVPRRVQPLRRREHAAQRWADVFAEDVGHAEVRFTVVQRHASGLNEGGHGPFLVGAR